MPKIKISKKEIGNIETPAEPEEYWDSKRWIPKIKIKEITPTKIPVIPLNDKLWIFLFNLSINLAKAKTTKKNCLKIITFQQWNVIN